METEIPCVNSIRYREERGTELPTVQAHVIPYMDFVSALFPLSLSLFTCPWEKAGFAFRVACPEKNSSTKERKRALFHALCAGCVDGPYVKEKDC